MFCGIFHFSFFKALSVAQHFIEAAESKAAYWSLLKMKSSFNCEGHLGQGEEQACIFTWMCSYTHKERFIYTDVLVCL